MLTRLGRLKVLFQGLREAKKISRQFIRRSRRRIIRIILQ